MANVACAIVGVAQGLLVLRLLGPGAFGVAAVIVALTAVAANIVDVRLTDLISNLYYADEAQADTRDAHRTSALRLGMRLYAIGAALIVLVSAGLLVLGARRLTGMDLRTSWIWMAAAAQGVTYLGSFFIFTQRFTIVPPRMALLQLASALINAGAMVASVVASRTVGGYVTGLMLSAIGIAALNAVYMIAAFQSNGIALFGARQTPAPAIDRRMVLRFVAAGNLLGYVKLLHRAADVLLVAAFCNDRQTGIYKLARSITDAFLTISEAIGRVYQPRLLVLLQQRDHTEYRSVARSLTTIAAWLTAAAIGAELLLLSRVAPLLGLADAQELMPSVIVLTLTFFFVAGLQLWIWPVFVFSGRLGRCTLWGAVGVLAGQYGLGTALVYITGEANPVWFSIGFLGYYVFSLLPLLRELHLERPSLAWRPQEASTL